MAAFVPYEIFLENLCEGTHDFTNTAAAVITLALEAAAPSPTTEEVVGNLTEIVYTNLAGDAAALPVSITSSTHTTDTYTLVLTDIVLTADGNLPTFRYVSHWANATTSPVDALIMYYDHGSNVDLVNLETFTVDYSASGFFTIGP